MVRRDAASGATGGREDLPLESALAESGAAVCFLRGPELVVAYANRTHRTIFGWPIGLAVREAPESAPKSAALAVAQRAWDTAEAAHDGEVPWGAGSFVSIDCSPIRTEAAVDGVLMVAVDVTEHVRSRKAVEDRHVRLTVIDQATTAVTADLDLHRELTALAQSVVPTLADACAVYLIDRTPSARATPGTLRATRLVCVVDQERGLAPPAPEVRMQLAARRPVTRAALSGDAVLADGPDAGVRSWGEFWLSVLNPHSLLAVPFGSPDVVAVVSFYACPPRAPFQAKDVTLIREISARAEVAVGHALRLQRTSEVALGLQRGLLSDPPDVAGLEITVRYRPAGPGLEVGGDWYDAFALPSAGLGVAVGDVVGHDLYAVSAMGQLRSMVQALACQPDAEPAAVLTALNGLSSHLGVGELATVVYGRITLADDGSSATLTWANAGHPPPLLVRPGADAAVLSGAVSPLLGLTKARYGQDTVVISPGDLLLIYTDGLIEDPSRTSDDPIADLAKAAAKHADLDIEELCDRLVASAPTRDDIALLAIRLRR